MAAMTTAEEYAAVREAIQALSTTSSNVVSINVDGVEVTYNRDQLTWLQGRETVLANRVCTRNRRKRTTPDFSY